LHPLPRQALAEQVRKTVGHRARGHHLGTLLRREAVCDHLHQGIEAVHHQLAGRRMMQLFRECRRAPGQYGSRHHRAIDLADHVLHVRAVLAEERLQQVAGQPAVQCLPQQMTTDVRSASLISQEITQ